MIGPNSPASNPGLKTGLD